MITLKLLASILSGCYRKTTAFFGIRWFFVCGSAAVGKTWRERHTRIKNLKKVLTSIEEPGIISFVRRTTAGCDSFCEEPLSHLGV